MSSKAREIHFKYRIFSALLFNKNKCDEEDICKMNWETSHELDNSIESYASIVLSDDAIEENSSVLQYLTWLEHRRWNAYMRSIGFSYNSKVDKNINLKLHGCLCECSKMPISGDSDIRLEDLKNRLFDYVCNEEKISKKGFETCIKKWKRLPQDCEQVQINLLLKSLFENFESIITTIHKDVRATHQKCQEEIDNINTLSISKQEKEGWTFGEVKDSVKKTTPLLVPYSELEENEKEYDRQTALETIKLIVSLGYSITKNK